LRKKVLAALNKTSEELFLAMQAAECNLAAAGPASPTGSSSKRNTPEPAHSGGIRRSVPKLSIDDRDMKNVVAKVPPCTRGVVWCGVCAHTTNCLVCSRAQADNDQQPRLKNMEKFFYIAGTPGLVALVLAFFGDDDDLAPAETTDQGLFALLNTTNSMASSLLSNVYVPYGRMWKPSESAVACN
jgi:hypothetical protein